MADLKISALPSATLPLAGTETIPLVQGGVTSKALASDLFQWPGGRVSYVPIGGNIQAYVTAATAGDTLILGAGTYTVTATITVDKAILIKGQGLSATKVVSATADIAVFTLTASSARITDLYIGHSGTGTTYGIYAGDGLSSLQVRNVTVVTSGAGVKFCIYSKSSITVSDTECYPTSSDSNSNGVYITNDSGATVNIAANIQGVRVIATGVTATTNGNRGLVAYNNNTVNTITVNLFNSQLTAVASAGSTDIALYSASTTSNSVTINAYDSVLSGADNDVFNTGSNLVNLFNCTLVNNSPTGTIVYAGTQVVAKLNGNTITAGTGVLTLAAGKTLTANNTLTLAGTDATTQTFPTTSATIARTDAAQTFAGIQTFSDTTDASNTTTAALKTDGGLAVARKGYFGGSVTAGLQSGTITQISTMGDATPFTIGASKTITFSLSGQSVFLIALSEGANGRGGIAMATWSSATITFLAQDGSYFANTASPIAGAFGIYKSANSGVISIVASSATSSTIQVTVIGGYVYATTDPA
jgi:hypothetical protein